MSGFGWQIACISCKILSAKDIGEDIRNGTGVAMAAQPSADSSVTSFWPLFYRHLDKNKPKEFGCQKQLLAPLLLTSIKFDTRACECVIQSFESRHSNVNIFFRLESFTCFQRQSICSLKLLNA